MAEPSPSFDARPHSAPAEITPITIERLVRTFYARVQSDPLIGPVFESRVHDWEDHIQRLCSFWESVLLMAGNYHGNPLARHAGLPIDGGHFTRWLQLFAAATGDLFAADSAAWIMARANRIGRTLESRILPAVP